MLITCKTCRRNTEATRDNKLTGKQGKKVVSLVAEYYNSIPPKKNPCKKAYTRILYSVAGNAVAN